MKTIVDDTRWEEITDTLRKLGVEFELRAKHLIPAKPEAMPSPPKRSYKGPGISMGMHLDGEGLSPVMTSGSDESQ